MSRRLTQLALLLTLTGGMSVGLASVGRADDPPPADVSGTEGAAPEEAPGASPDASPDKINNSQAPTRGSGKNKRKQRGDRDAEGTEALGRFEADTVIKSQYRINGDSLEVDPD